MAKRFIFTYITDLNEFSDVCSSHDCRLTLYVGSPKVLFLKKQALKIIFRYIIYIIQNINNKKTKVFK